MSQSPKFTRREFNHKASRYLGVAAVAAATPALWSCTSEEEPTAFEDPAADKSAPEAPAAPTPAAEIKMVDPESPSAKALNYCHDVNSPEPHCPARAGEDKQGQYCTNCLFFNVSTARTVDGAKVENIDDQRDVVVAECQLLPGQGYVAGKGWCQSWAKRQG